MRTHLKTALAAVVVIAAVCIWSHSFRRLHTVELQSLRDVGGVTNMVIGLQKVPHGYQIQCRLANQRRKLAQQVVLRASVTDNDSGQVLAANPLASAANLAPGESREFNIFVPLETSPTNVRAQAVVSLVRWQE